MSEERARPEDMGGTGRLDRKIMRGSGWSAINQFTSQGLSIVSMLVLARLLDPKAFGLVALAWTFLTFLHYVQNSGVTSSLIFWEDRLEAVAASSLWYAPIVGFVLSTTTVVAAPLIASLFKAPPLGDVLRVMALVILVRSFGMVPSALMVREFMYRRLAKAEISGGAVQAGVAIGLAFAGAGVWSLVVGAIAGQAVQTLLYWAFVPWRPSPWKADFAALRQMLRYGRYVSAARVVSLLNRTLDNMTVARVLGTTALGFYASAFRLSSLPATVIGNIVGKPMFSAYSRLRDDRPEFRRAYVQNLQRTVLFALPASILLVVAAEPIVLAMLGEKWRAAIGPLRILGVFGLIRTVTSTAGDVWGGDGKPHFRLVWELVLTALTLPLLIVFTHLWGINGTALAMLTVHGATGIPAMAITMRMLELRPAVLARALAPLLACAGLLTGWLAILLPMSLRLDPWLALGLLASGGLAAYALATMVLARGVVITMWTSLRGRPQPRQAELVGTALAKSN